MRGAVILTAALLYGCTSEGLASRDMAGRDFAFAVDASVPPDIAEPVDLARSADLSRSLDMAMGQLGCGGLIMCYSNCGNNQNCANACEAATSPMGLQLYDAFINCVFGSFGVGGACPTGPGQVCDPAAANPTPCQMCSTNAINGACAMQWMACQNNP
jgi:hypothetical protein